MSRGGGSRAWRGVVRATLQAKGTTCALCGLPGADSADHIIPVAAGGSDQLLNLQPAHRRCNSQRQDMPLARWYELHPLPKRAPPTREW